ncbi:hypothetical protein TTHERM_01279560 (macronuclear) [Tetrahymena thermophila SB210]|uniref:Kinase domain protein n=1 Tax=Tetrahymena thermophila (strain SB210) TaxID=312017 RepID=Q24CN6_TETTS|nr:hypothetical protein TTHERM_01279560 [Tetrahymena thermophila SB210]EAS05528.3 hypothetical protein TTHERM_01279560 [Tetrahymena thermophila SB210]|eukprot:XP_001025773.3 hypothetical protein TTHERM_01279560 [Tetrahymena thermophila SB210]
MYKQIINQLNFVIENNQIKMGNTIYGIENQKIFKSLKNFQSSSSQSHTNIYLKFKLKKEEKLNLFKFKFETDMQVLCSTLEKCINLKILILEFDWSKIDSQNAEKLGLALTNCINICILSIDLNGNQIGDVGASNLCKGLTKLTHLSQLTLKLNGNNIRNEGAIKLAKDIQACQRLLIVQLFLYRNYISVYQLNNILGKSKRLVKKYVITY